MKPRQNWRVFLFENWLPEAQNSIKFEKSTFD
ncbi:hypothetical protein MED193_05271 [Roseobacter sp. MED193]|nr:hypothetical protein MED193_05271 [Roseobacter sp. MED193]